jgi:hypothetical protein
MQLMRKGVLNVIASQEEAKRIVGGVLDGKTIFSKASGDTEIKISERTSRWLGLYSKESLFANLEHLRSRHPEYYETSDQVRADIEYVLEKPNDWFIPDGTKIAIFRQQEGSIPSVRIDFDVSGGRLRIRSVYRQTKRSVVKKIGEKNAKLKEMGLVGTSGVTSSSGMIPERLTVAEYIHRLSDPSARSADGPPISSSVATESSGLTERLDLHPPPDNSRAPSERPEGSALFKLY